MRRTRPEPSISTRPSSSWEDILSRADRTLANHVHCASGLHLVIAAIAYWNTTCIERAMAYLRTRGDIVPEALPAHISPIGSTAHRTDGGYLVIRRFSKDVDLTYDLRAITPGNLEHIMAPKSSSIGTSRFAHVTSFLQEIGITAVRSTAADIDGFLTGIEIREGVLYCDPDVAATTDFLHEAGHLAVIPARFRRLAGRDVQCSLAPHYDSYFDQHPCIRDDGSEDPVIRAILQSGETEAIAWAWAAGRHLGIGDEEIMPDDGVFWISDDDIAMEPGGAETRARLQAGQYFGINGLIAAGMAASKILQTRHGAPAYPSLLKWIQN